MRGKLLPVLWLAIVAYGCERKSGTTGGATDTSVATVPDTATAPAGKPEILSVTVRVRTAEGKVGNVEVDLDKKEGSDALFLSQEALENFVVPFYRNRKGEGPDSAAALLKQARAELERNGFLIILHKLRCKVLFPGDKLRGRLPLKL